MNKIPCGGFHISGGNFVEMDGQKILTPLGGGVIDYPIHYEGSVVGIGSGDGHDSVVVADGIQIPFPLVVGRKYHVVINGVGQDLECYDDQGYYTIGNAYDDFEDAKVNMWQIYEEDEVDDEGVIHHWISFSCVGRLNQVYNFSLDGVVEEVKQIDEKFLPNRIKTTTYIEFVAYDMGNDGYGMGDILTDLGSDEMEALGVSCLEDIKNANDIEICLHEYNDSTKSWLVAKSTFAYISNYNIDDPQLRLYYDLPSRSNFTPNHGYVKLTYSAGDGWDIQIF